MSLRMPVNFVGAGSYIISGRKNCLLESMLGTCIGITICDPTANVGGLIHLLLPEPPNKIDPWQPEKYAATGLPIFIDALLKVGASRERMRACIAGGALIDPVCDMDFSLDIGGRTFEIAEQVLRKVGIPIVAAETGGFFSCRLNLNLQTWESRIAPTDTEPDSDNISIGRPLKEELSTAIEQVKPIPQVALKIIRMIGDSNHGLREIAKDVRTDQVLSAKVLSLCNSAFMGLSRKVRSIDQALILIGEKQILRLVIAISLEKLFFERGRGYSLCKGGLFYHAMGTAVVAEDLAMMTGKASPAMAYTAGLLHDIGKAVLDQYMAPVFQHFYRETHLNGVALTDAERELFGIDHAEIGKELGERWCLPRELINTISQHHRLNIEGESPEQTFIVYLADLIMSRFMTGQELEHIDTSGLLLRMRNLDLKPEQFYRVIDHIPLGSFKNMGADSDANQPRAA